LRFWFEANGISYTCAAPLVVVGNTGNSPVRFSAGTKHKLSVRGALIARPLLSVLLSLIQDPHQWLSAQISWAGQQQPLA
jgi:hypothetical protein